jgi:hypothetical protein
MANRVRLIEIDFVDLQESEITLAVLRRPDLSLNRIARTQTKAPHLAWADINIIGAWPVV